MVIQLNYRGICEGLWRLATGKDPDGSEAWKAFAEDVVQRVDTAPSSRPVWP